MTNSINLLVRITPLIEFTDTGMTRTTTPNSLGYIFRMIVVISSV